MEKKRVKKGEPYWYINIGLKGVNVSFAIDFRDGYTNRRFKVGNYFSTKEEAEAMAKKIKAVLQGADVIETPESNEIDIIQREIGLEVGREDEELVEAASQGAIKMINWLIDYIAK